MESIFHEAQQSLAKHRRCAERLRVLQRSTPPSDFAHAFFGCVCCLLPLFKREASVERSVEFLVKFLTEPDEETSRGFEVHAERAVEQAGRASKTLAQSEEESHGGIANEEDEGETEGGGSQDALLSSVCMALLGLSDAKDKAVRFRVAQIVGRVMNAMPEEAEVAEELFSALEERMLRRCRDKVPVVRACALRSLFRLQDPSEPDDKITGEMLRMMETDSSAEVRMAAISTIAPSKPAIRALLGRTRDTSENVRKHALSVIREKVEMRWLTISQRAALLEQSLADRAPAVRAACVELTRAWLRKADKQVLVLLKALDVSMHESAAERVVRALMEEAETRALVAAAAAQWQSLSPEPVLCLHVHLEYLAAEAKRSEDPKAEEALEGAVPELDAYCEALHRAVAACNSPTRGQHDAETIAASYSLVQLLRICPQLDMANEHGRVELENAFGTLLKDLGVADDLLAPLVCALKAVCIGEGERFQRLMHEFISEVDDPLEAVDGAATTDPAAADERLQVEQRRMFVESRLLALHDEVKARVQEEDFDGAAALKREAATLQTELAALPPSRGTPEEEAVVRTTRCLKLAELLMRMSGSNLAQHEMDMHAESTFLPALAAPQPRLRALALRCLGLRALGCATQAAKTWPLFVKALAHDQLPVQLAALAACTDLLLVHPPEALLECTDPTPKPSAAPLPPMEDSCSRAVFDLLLPLLRGSDRLLRSAAALAGCRLLFTGRVVSSSLTARLLLLYFQSDSDSVASGCASVPSADLLADAGLTDASSRTLVDLLCEPKQMLSVFFASYSASAQLGAALLPAVRAVLAAAPGSPEAVISVDALASFILNLTRSSDDAAGPAATLHESIALALCCESLTAPHEVEGTMLPRAFAHVILPAARHCRRLIPLTQLLSQLEAKVTDKIAVRHVQKLSERVAALSLAQSDAEAQEDNASVGSPDSGYTVEEIISAHSLLRDGDTELSEAILRERERARDEQEGVTFRRHSLTPVKTKAPSKRRLAKGGKATPGMAERLASAAQENVVVN